MEEIINLYRFLYDKAVEIWRFFGRGGMTPFFFPRGSMAEFNLLWLFTQLLGLVAFALILTMFFKSSESIIKGALNNFWKNMMTGIAVFLATPIVGVIVFITIIGILPGFAILSAYSFLTIFAIIYAGMVFGSVIFKVLKGAKTVEFSWYSAVVGVISLFIIGLIPIIGGVIYLLFFLISLGSISSNYFNRIS